MIKKLNFDEDIMGKMSPMDVVKHYFPDISENEADFIIWEQTCFPMDHIEFTEQVYELYKKQQDEK